LRGPLEGGSDPPCWRLPCTSRPHAHPCRSLLVAPGSAKQGVVTLFARWASVRTSAHLCVRLGDMSWARHSHLPVRERSPDIPLDGVMQDGAYLRRRILLPRTRVNKGKERSRNSSNPRRVTWGWPPLTGPARGWRRSAASCLARPLGSTSPRSYRRRCEVC
jgi:hypothetical protein